MSEDAPSSKISKDVQKLPEVTGNNRQSAVLSLPKYVLP